MGRRRRWAGLRARCAGSQPAVTKPGSESAGDGEGSVGDEEEVQPQFDLNLAVVLAGFAFEAYSSPPTKLKNLRIKELNNVLQQLGLSKKGKKQELVDKIEAILSDQQDQVSNLNGKQMIGKEKVLKVVDDTFRKLHEPANSVTPSKNQVDSGLNGKPKKKLNASAQVDVKVRCPCGNSMANGPMIKCDDPECNVWQHIGCVITSEKSADNVPPELPFFYCDICRINRADPFWVTINHILLPTVIAPSKIAADGSYTVQYFEKIFPLSRANREMLEKAEYDLQSQTTDLATIICSSTSVTGLHNNEYQITRGKELNRLAGLSGTCDFVKEIGVEDNKFCYRCVVVFQYRSAVLSSIADHEAEHYLHMIRNHASG